MEGMTITLSDDRKVGSIILSKEFYEREAVFFVADMFSRSFYVNVMPKNDNQVCLALENKKKDLINEDLLKEVCNSLVMIQTARDLQKEFGSLRDKIVEQAFSSAVK